MTEVTLIISVYKKTKELKIVLSALKKQSCKSFEIIIADDDSGDEMKNIVTDIRSDFPVPVKFVTHNFTGFGKNIILNKAIGTAESDYLIFMDGDCIPHKHFIKAHLTNRKPGTILCGRRVMLGEMISKKIKELKTPNEFEIIKLNKLFRDFLNSKNPSLHIEEGIYIRNKKLNSLLHRKVPDILGCNFSIPKELIEKVNGFDENYTGPGIGEDTDLEFRLRLISANFESVRNFAIVYHLYHPKTIEESKNYDYFHNHVKKSNNFFCKNGLKKLI